MSFKVKLTDEEYRQYIKDMNDMGLEDKHKDETKDLSTKNQYVYFLDGTKVSYDPTLLQALEKGVHLATNEETREKIRDEINYIKKQIRDKQFVDLGTPKKDAITIKFSNKNHLNSPTKLATKKSLALESFNEKYFMSSYSREDLYRNLTKEDLKEANKDLEKELGVGNFCYSPEIDLNEEDFLSQYNNTKDKDVFLQDLYSLLKLANERNNAEDIKNIQDKINLILNKQLKGDIKVSSKVSLKQKNKKETDLIANKSLAYENLEEDIKLDKIPQITDTKSVFSNSKVRDSKGNLLKCYHSSDNDFDNFEIKDNVNGRLYGSGIYFSTNSDYMFSYGKIGYECYLNIINPWYFNSSYEEIKNLIEKDTNESVNEIKLKEYFAKGYGSDTTILDYYENVIKEKIITFKDLLIRNNYDGIIVCDDREELENRYTEIIAFDPNQIYIIKKYYSEKKNLGLEEDIEKHDTLNPLLFDEDDELKPEIKEAIEKIVNQFVEDLKTDGVKIEVKDVILVGSNVSYNYTKDSDLDVHIIVDENKLDCDPEIYTLLYGAYRSLFNKNYNITIKGIPVEIYVELV